MRHKLLVLQNVIVGVALVAVTVNGAKASGCTVNGPTDLVAGQSVTFTWSGCTVSIADDTALIQLDANGGANGSSNWAVSMNDCSVDTFNGGTGALGAGSCTLSLPTDGIFGIAPITTNNPDGLASAIPYTWAAVIGPPYIHYDGSSINSYDGIPIPYTGVTYTDTAGLSGLAYSTSLSNYTDLAGIIAAIAAQFARNLSAYIIVGLGILVSLVLFSLGMRLVRRWAH